nr:hypothetical protein [Haloparvum sedimenti]
MEQHLLERGRRPERRPGEVDRGLELDAVERGGPLEAGVGEPRLALEAGVGEPRLALEDGVGERRLSAERRPGEVPEAAIA